MVAAGRLNATYEGIKEHWNIYTLFQAVDLTASMVYNEEQAHEQARRESKKQSRR